MYIQWSLTKRSAFFSHYTFHFILDTHCPSWEYTFYFLSIFFLILKNIDVNLFSSLCNLRWQRIIILWNLIKEKVFYLSLTIRNNTSLYLDKHHAVFGSFLLGFFFPMIEYSSDSSLVVFHDWSFSFLSLLSPS